jgi:hypothetical protein
MTLKGSDVEALSLTSTSTHYWTQRLYDDDHWHDMPGHATTSLEEARANFDTLRATGWKVRVIMETRIVTTEVLDA